MAAGLRLSFRFQLTTSCAFCRISDCSRGVSAIDLFERRTEQLLESVRKRSSSRSMRGRFQNKGNTCWLGSLLQGLLSSEVLQCFLALHHRTPSCAENCPVCILATTESQSREMQQLCDVEPLWRIFYEHVSGRSWTEQQDPLEFLLSLGATSPDFFSPFLTARLNTTVVQTLPCTCGVELPPPHIFPTQPEFVVPLKVPQSSSGVSKLVDIIDLMKEERPDNSVTCPICDAQAGFVSTHRWHYGSVIIFQLARSSDDTDAVTLEPEVSLGGASYVLRAAVCHRGQVNSGHYVCFVVEQSTGRWVRYNDGDVPTRLPQAPTCLTTHSAFAVYEVVLPLESLAELCAVTSSPSVEALSF